jgi:hypothetical protein
MNLATVRLAFSATWGLIGLALLLRKPLGLTELDESAPGTNFTLIGAVALVFFGWNLVRWYAARPTPVARHKSILAKKSDAPATRPTEYHPEFDFTAPAPSESPNPGEQKPQ